MAEYKSRFPELGFYVGDELYKFTAGRYVTEDPGEIEVLNGLTDAERVDATEEKTEEPAKPARKSSAK